MTTVYVGSSGSGDPLAGFLELAEALLHVLLDGFEGADGVEGVGADDGEAGALLPVMELDLVGVEEDEAGVGVEGGVRDERVRAHATCLSR